MTTPQKETILGSRAAVILGSALLAGFIGIACLATLDAGERKQLETFVSPSAAGDPVVILPPNGEPGPNSVAILRVNGVLHYGEDIVDYSEGTMMKAGQDDSGEILLYQRIRKNKRLPDLFVKIGAGRFLEVAPREEAAPSAEPAASPAEAAPSGE